MIARRMLGIGAALLVASAAQAGPITWGYSSAFETVGGNWDPSNVITTLQNIHHQYVSELLDASGGPKTGWQTVTVGIIRPLDGHGGDPRADIPFDYRLTVRLTDTISGETGTVVYVGGAGEIADWVNEPPFQTAINRHAFVVGLTPQGDETLTLGGHEYRVKLTARSHADGNAYLDAAVEVGETHETPEPGTLVLCGLALAGGAGAWVRRRAKRDDGRPAS